MSYTGPFKATLLACEKKMDYHDRKSAIGFNIRFEIEPRFGEFMAGKCLLVEAVADDGKALAIPNAPYSSSWWNSSRSGSLTCSDSSGPEITDAPADLKKLAKLTVEITCKLILKTNTLKIDGILSGKGTSKEADGITAEIMDVRKTDDETIVEIKLKGKSVEAIDSDMLAPKLVNKDGQKICEGYSRSMRYSSNEARMTLAFSRSSLNDAEPALVLTLPGEDVERKFTFSFPDVRIP